jgi:hypothetical protein
LGVSIFDNKLKSQEDKIDSSVALAAGCKAPGGMARKKHPDPSNSSRLKDLVKVIFFFYCDTAC